MNKNAIKKFAIDARNKLIASVTDKAAMLGITPDNCSEAITKGADFEVYKTAAGTEVTLNKKQCEQRRKLVDQIHARGFETVVEEVAYTWFNRICAIRFMEVNDYMYPVRVRVLSSEKEGKNEPDVVTMAPDIDWDFTDKEREEIIDAKMNNRLDDLFRMLFIKQCNLLHEVLPGLFEETEDYTEMLLNISFTNEDDVIRMLVDGIDEKDFNITTVDEDGKAAGQVEIIGWLYQYYNTEPKNKAFAKKAKITKEEIPAVTQLFTPDWIVRYMVENSLGRMWVEGHPDDELKSKWKYYLDEAKQEESVQQELDKIKAEYATLKPEDIKLIDPCMGSGHILVYAFDVFMQIYENAGWSQRDAAQSIIQNNIYGLDIDDRAAQLSYFAVLMKARQYDRRILTRGIEPNVYAVQEGNGISRGQLKYFGAGLTDTEKNVAVSQMEGLLNTLNDAKEYGSLLNMEDYDWELLEKFVENTDTESQISFDTFGLDETAEQLKQLIRIGKVMAQKYEVVATNPPYAGTSNLSAKVNNFVKKNYPDSKADLFAVFIERCGEMLKKNGYQAMITQHSWMFLSSYEKLRIKLQKISIVNMAHLGARAFEEIAGEVVQTSSFILSKKNIRKFRGVYSRLVDANNQSAKEELFLSEKKKYVVNQDNFNKIPGNPITYWASEKILKAFSTGVPLSQMAIARNGVKTGDNQTFVRMWQEINYTTFCTNASDCHEAIKSGLKWFPYNKGGESRRWYGNNDYVVDWQYGGKRLFGQAKIDKRNVQDYPDEMKFTPSCTWSLINTGTPTFRFKEHNISDIAGMSFYQAAESNLYLLGLCNFRKADLQRDLKSLISYAVGCMFGRYSLNIEGLAYAGGEWNKSIYSAYDPDRDNIIPICDEEYFPDDIVSRFCEWVKIVYGEKSWETNLDFIAKALGNKGNTSREVIRNYFLNDFFKDHCNTYSVTGSGKRPIYWLFDSGKQNGFKALIYMHRYDADTVGRVRTDYLHKAQKYVETAMQSAQYTIDNATSASEKSKATKAVTKYTKQLAEMRIYDEAIAHVANQRIEIDLDDGVKVNYAKFQGVEVAQEGKKALKVDLLAKI